MTLLFDCLPAGAVRFRGDPSINIISAISAELLEGGIPRQRFKKAIIRAETYQKDETQFEITPALLDHWCVEFEKMKTAGVKVPIPNGHENASDAEQNRGYVDSLFVEGDTLFMLCTLIGKDAIQTAARCDVSIFAPVEFKDGHGNIYQRPITHIALCVDPVVPGLSDFLPLAASQSLKGKQMKWKELQETLKLSADVKLSEDNAAEVLSKHFDGLQKSVDDFDKKVKELETQLSKSKPKAKKVIDEQSLSLAHELIEAKIEALVTGGHLTTAAAEDLTEVLLKDDEQSFLQFSLGEAKRLTLFTDLFAALKKNKAISLDSNTGEQSLSLHDRNKEGSGNSLFKDAMSRAELAKKTG